MATSTVSISRGGRTSNLAPDPSTVFDPFSLGDAATPTSKHKASNTNVEPHKPAIIPFDEFDPFGIENPVDHCQFFVKFLDQFHGFGAITMMLTIVCPSTAALPSKLTRFRNGQVRMQPIDLIGFLLLSRIAHKLAYYAVAIAPFALVFYLCRH